MILPKRDTARRLRAQRNNSDATKAPESLELYILGDDQGRVDDPVESGNYLVRRDEAAPVESFPYAAIAPIPIDAGTGVLVGWHDGGRKILYPSTRVMKSSGRKATILNTADTRIYGYWSKEGYGDLKCVALGTTANPSTKYAINARSWITDEYEAVGFQGVEGDVASSIPGGTDQHRLAVTILKADLTTVVLTSTAVSVLTPLNAGMTYLQECIDALPPRAIPVQVFRLYSGQTTLTEADKIRGGDLRDLINNPPPRMNWNAITDPDADEDSTIGYGVGSKWINRLTPSVWICVDDAEGAAVWQNISAADAADLTYTPSVDADWVDPNPTTVQGGLDDLAEDLTDLSEDLTDLSSDVADIETFISTFDAHDVPYVPTDVTDWNGSSDPGSTGDGIDQLADRTKALEAGSDNFTITAGETLAQRDYVYFKASDNKWYKVDTNVIPVACSGRRALVTQSGGIASSATGTAQARGIVGGFSSLTPGAPVYASTTAGSYTQTKPTLSAGGGQVALIILGVAVSATQIELKDIPAIYHKREILDIDDTMTIEHHPDSHMFTRQVRAYPSLDIIGGILTQYADTNYTINSPIKKSNPATYTADQCTGGTPSASSFFPSGGTWTANQAFDGNTATTYWISNSTQVAWLEYEFATTKAIRSYTIYAPQAGFADATMAPKTWTFEYWNGSSWVVVDTKTSQANWSNNESRTFTFLSPATSTKWRINVTVTQATTAVAIASLQMNEVATYTDGFVSLAQGFQVPTATPIEKARIYGVKSSSPTAATRVKIRANSGGDPGTVLATSSDVASSTWSNSIGWIEYTFPSPFTPTPATQYHLELEYDGSQLEFTYINWGVDNTSPGYTGGTNKAYNGSTWADASVDAIFELIGLDTQYEGALSIGAWTETNPAILNRFDDGAEGNLETNTTFKNNFIDDMDVTCIVEVL